jgi:MFS family permease
MLLLTALLMPIFVFPVQQILPVFAKNVFEWEDIGLGILAASTGVGGLAGTLIAANFDYLEHKGRMMLGGAVLMAIATFAFALTPIIWGAAILLAIANMGSMLFMTTNNTVIQARVPDEYRGRVMSMLMMSFGLSPLGVIPVTVAADAWGAPAAVAGAAVALLVLVLAVFSLSGRLRNLRVGALEEAEMSPAQAARLVAEGKITREEADRLSGRASAAGAPGGG